MTGDATLNLGFLTILQQEDNYIGGFLATNQWGRPLEFRLTSAVQPNRVQQILYSKTLQPYICADLIGKTLVEKTPVPVGLVVTDHPSALDLRLHLQVPVAWIDSAASAEFDLRGTCPSRSTDAHPVRDNIYCHAQFAEDASRIDRILNNQVNNINIAEPFQRIREAMTEARRCSAGGKK